MNNQSGNAAGGEASNTSPTAYYSKSVCIDYFKFRFDFSYDESREKFKTVIYDLLKANNYEIGSSDGYNFFDKKLAIAPGITLLYGGEKTSLKNGSSTSLLEMKGEGCREFENRYYRYHPDFGLITKQSIIHEGWIALFKECQKLGGKCTRIDIPTDDFTGNITIDEIKEKIDKREYTTRMRAIRHISEDKDDGKKKPDKLNGKVEIRDSKISGYSVTFGNSTHVELCIYDKYAEQHKKGFRIGGSSWVRYEVRYFRENAELEFPLLLQALEEKKEVRHILGCLAGMFEFKEPHHFNKRNLYKAAVWSKWKQFIGDVEKRGYFSKTPDKNDIQSMISWLKFTCSGCMAKSLAATDTSIAEFIGALLIQGTRKWTKEDLQKINKARIDQKLPPFKSVLEAQQFVFNKTDFPEEFSKDIQKFIISLQKKKDSKD